MQTHLTGMEPTSQALAGAGRWLPKAEHRVGIGRAVDFFMHSHLIKNLHCALILNALTKSAQALGHGPGRTSRCQQIIIHFDKKSDHRTSI